MAASAQMPRMSFGASNTLDLSLNLPIVLLPPSAGPHFDSDSDDDDDRRSLRHEAKSHEPQIVALRGPPQDDLPANGTTSRDTQGNDRPEDDLAHDPEAQHTPTSPDAPAPLIPERNTRRTSKQLEQQHPPPPAPVAAPAPAPPPTTNSGIPLHPIASMQAAFAESLLEVTDGKPADKPKLRFGDAKARREELISQERDEELYCARWRYRPGQQQHELHKLMAQISFGVYLLLNGMANSAAQVVSILQGHIDEVDEFLEVTMEDFQQASADLKERIDYLRLPMENMEVFEKLLEDRNFRLQIVEGNEKIEHIVARTNMQLEQYDKDVQQGLASARDFAVYLTQQKDGSWSNDRPDVVDIYEAMKGNTEGWFNAFADLQAQGKELNALVVKLGLVVSEMSSKAGEVSRRTWVSPPPYAAPKPKHTNSRLLTPRNRLASHPSRFPCPSLPAAMLHSDLHLHRFALLRRHCLRRAALGGLLDARPARTAQPMAAHTLAAPSPPTSIFRRGKLTPRLHFLVLLRAGRSFHSLHSTSGWRPAKTRLPTPHPRLILTATLIQPRQPA